MGPAVGQSDDDGAGVGRLVVGRRKHRRVSEYYSVTV
jgi:hypothetical protein